MERRTHRGLGEGTVGRRTRPVRGGHWVIAYYDETRKRRFEYGFKTMHEARAALEQREERRKARLPVRPTTERGTLEQLLGRWLHISLEARAGTGGGRHYADTLYLLQRLVVARPISQRAPSMSRLQNSTSCFGR
jgi:hypothetical protein